jgi:pimeloyl-ACP methyl ester carboxylesterase
MKLPLLLLHGAIGSADQFDELTKMLGSKIEVHALDFPGHGKQPFPEEPFSIAQFADYVVQWMDQKKLLKVDVFGYSMGGFVGMYMASHFPERINRVFTLATKFNWSKEIAQREVGLLDPDVIEEKLPDFAHLLKKRHASKDWKEVLKRTADMLTAMGRKNPLNDEDLRTMNQEVLIGMGDRDNMVIIEESVYAYRLLKNGSLLVIPGTPHPIEKVALPRLKQEILSFFQA